jgi:hypothetical protein
MTSLLDPFRFVLTALSGCMPLSMSRTGLIRLSLRGIRSAKLSVACQDVANHTRTFDCTGATISINLKKGRTPISITRVLRLAGVRNLQ